MQQVVDKARVPLNDAKKGTPADGVRWKDATLLGYGVDALSRLLLMRPDLFVGQFSNLPDFSTYTLISTFPLTQEYVEPVCDYIRARAQTHDTEAVESSMAPTFFRLFESAAGG